MGKNILEVKNLKIHFYTEEGTVKAVNGLDFSLSENETLAIVGESGCGKSVTALGVLGIIPQPPGKILDGEILFKGKDLLKKSQREMRRIRGNEISMIFQEPLTSLNPVFTVGKQVMESFRIHQGLSKSEAREKTIEMIELVGIPSPEKVIDDYPHQLSGGMRQRIMIASALACNPEILIADEPTTALDVTIQAQIMSLLNQIKEGSNTSIILITHDFGVVAQIAHNVMVMYAGEMVEYGDVHSIFKNPLHPYTEGLLQSIPVIGKEREKLFSIEGTVPSIKNYPIGCPFFERCNKAMPKCKDIHPEITMMEKNRKVRCFLYQEVDNND